MRFSVGDRIAVYGPIINMDTNTRLVDQPRFAGAIILNYSADWLIFKADCDGREYRVHTNQCRKLIKKEKTPTEKLQALYDSEINFRVECFWDDGFEWSLGDECNGYVITRMAQKFADFINDLWAYAKFTYPDAKCFKEEK